MISKALIPYAYTISPISFLNLGPIHFPAFSLIYTFKLLREKSVNPSISAPAPEIRYKHNITNV